MRETPNITVCVSKGLMLFYSHCFLNGKAFKGKRAVVRFSQRSVRLCSSYCGSGCFLHKGRFRRICIENLFRKGNDVRREKEKNRLRELRERRTMTYHELAEELERLHWKKYQQQIVVSWQMMRAIEYGYYSPSLKLGVMIADFFQTEVKELFFELNGKAGRKSW